MSPNTSRSSKEENQARLARKTKDTDSLEIAWWQNSVNSQRPRDAVLEPKSLKGSMGLKMKQSSTIFRQSATSQLIKQKPKRVNGLARDELI